MRSTKFSPRQAAEKSGRRYGQIIRAIKAGKLKAEKVDWGWIITNTELKRYAKNEGLQLR